MTRLLLLLGTRQANASPLQTLYYAHLRAPPSSSLPPGTAVALEGFDELQVAQLGGALGEGRFGKVTSHSAASLSRDRHAITGTGAGTGAGTGTGVGTGGVGVTGTGTGTGVANISSPTPAPPAPPTPAPHVRSLRTSRRTQDKGANTHDTRANTRDAGCARYMGHIGGDWPTPQRGHWFPLPGDVDSFRQSLREACPPHAPQLASHAKSKRYKLVIYQRDRSRRLAGEAEAVERLGQVLGDAWSVHVLMHSNDRGPCELAHALHNADLLLTPHGFQSMLLLFMPRPSLLFEVFPYRYYKNGYGNLGGEYGVTHMGVMSPPTTWHTALTLPFISTERCMDSKQCRGYARDQDVL